MLFFLAAAVLTLFVAAVLVRPLLKPLPPPAAPGRYNMAVYRDQLEELRRDEARQAIAPADAAAARLEIERRLVSAAREAEPEAAPRRAPAALALALAAVLFVGAGAIYLAIGHPAYPDQPLARRLAQAQVQAQAQTGSQADGSDPARAEMDRMVALLAQKLAADPDHPDGWALLARSYLHLGQAQQAVQAYARAVSLTPKDDPALDGEYAEARVIAAGGQVDATAQRLFRRRLAAQPGDPQARYYLALARAQAGDVKGALADWRALEAASPPDAPWLPALRQRMAEAAGQPVPAAAIPGAAAEMSAAQAPGSETPRSEPPGSGPSADQVAAADQLSAADRAAMVQGMVDRLAAHLQQAPDDLDGWRRLARADQVLGRPADAAAAERQVLRLAPDDAAAKAALAGR